MVQFQPYYVQGTTVCTRSINELRSQNVITANEFCVNEQSDCQNEITIKGEC